MARTLALAVSLLALAALGEVRTVQPDALELHAQGAGKAIVADGSLLLDLRSPTAGKHAWAVLPLGIKLPATVEWDQMVVADSPHFYRGGLFVQDAFGRLARIGFSGQPQGNHVAFDSRLLDDTRYEVGTWYRFRLEIGTDHHAKLSVRPRDAEAPVWTASGRFGTAGLLCRIGFYHNQEPDLPPDEYAQDRGAARFAHLRIEAAGLREGSLDSYRDPQVRGSSTRDPMTFNRAMRWLTTKAGVLAYDAAPQVLLTGSEQAAEWSANRGCRMVAVDPRISEFVRPNDLDGPDQANLRCFQWALRQHPVLEYSLEPSGGPAWLEVTLPCPYLGNGIRIFRTEPATVPVQGSLDLLPLFAQFDLAEHQYGEIGLHLFQERGGADGESRCRVRLALAGSGALLTTVPVVRSPAQPITIAAILAGGDGQLGTGSVTARWDGLELPLTAGKDGVFTAQLPPLPVGRHWIDLTSQQLTNRLLVVVAAPDFLHHEPGEAGYRSTDGHAVPALLGDLLAWVPMLDPDQATRRVIASTAAYEALAPEEHQRVRLVKLRTLGREELAAMLEEQARNGFGVVRLTPNVSPHESFLDAGGHIAPYSLETLSWTLDECRQRGIRALINLFHYPYWSGGTGSFPPWRQYLDVGCRDARSFFADATTPLLHSYLAELLIHLRDDPAVFGYSLTGENDQAYGPEWINGLFSVVREHDPNHPVTLEQGGGMERCSGGRPTGYDAFLPVASAGLGYRTYYTGGLPSDAYMMLCGRFYSTHPPSFMAEVCSGPGWYGGFYQNWTHPDFLTKARDAIWMSVLRQQTVCVTWSAPWTQEERLIPSRCQQAIDWDHFTRQRPLAAVRLSGDIKPLLPRLGEIEGTLAAAGIDYDFIWEDADYAWVIDPNQPLGGIPPAVLADRPLAVTPGHSVNVLRGATPFQLLALVKNTASYRLGPGYGTGVKENHRQRTDAHPLALTFQNIPANSRLVLYDLDTRQEIRRAAVGPGTVLDLGTTAHDFALVLRATESAVR